MRDLRPADSVRNRIAMALGVLAFVTLAFATGASAHVRPRTLSPQQSISGMILVHNTIGQELYGEFNDMFSPSAYSGDLERCEGVERESGEARELGQAGLREAVAQILHTVDEVYGEFNTHTVPAWITFAKGLKRKVSKGKRAAVAHVAKLLEEAHIEHSDEFFHMKAIWVAMEGVHCATAASEEKAAATAGSSAWTFEAAALRQLAGLFGVKNKIEYPVGPYV